MSEDRGIGSMLRAAREEKGWTTNDVGGRLRLTVRQVEAIENEEFSKLGPAVFARGFVRNYAKLLGLEPDDLLEQMTRIRVTPVRETDTAPFTPSDEFWKSPWVVGGIAAAVLLVAIPVGLYLWLNSDGDVAAPAVQQAASPPPPPPAPVLNGQPATPAAPEATQNAAATEAPSAQAPAPVSSAPLRMQFEEASWVQVRDDTGRMLHSALNPAGTTLEIDGKAPFYLLIGNAEKVRVTYKGQVIDLKPFTTVNVARLTLNP